MSSRVFNALKADAKTVDLRSLAGHYYALAAMVLLSYDEEEIVEPVVFDEEEIVDLLCEVRYKLFRGRAIALMRSQRWF